MMSRQIAAVTAVFFLAAGTTVAERPDNSPHQWQLIGSGFAAAVDDASLLAEYPGSKGVMLVHPGTFGAGVSLAFDVMPLNPESVLVAIIGASNDGKELRFPDDYDGDNGYLLTEVKGISFALHNAAHNRTPFIRQLPFDKNTSRELAVAGENVMSTRWHRVAVSSDKDSRLQLSIDGNILLSASSPHSSSDGRIILRIRGTRTHTASVLIRNVVIDSLADPD